MKIGIDFSVIESLVSTTEDTGYYLRLLISEGHDLNIVTTDSTAIVKEWLSSQGLECLVLDAQKLSETGNTCGHFDLYMASQSGKPLIPVGVVKNFLLFPDQVNTWWGLYNHIRYEL